jgi:protein-S-isoprenylcysteine O-methyltransferase Ste14
MMKTVLSTAYALVAYVAFLGSFTALVLASTGLLPALVPAVDGPPRQGMELALAVDVALVLAFGVQHTVMAREGFKRHLTRVVPEHLERSTFVLASALCTAAIAFWWAPIGGDVWDVKRGTGLALAVQGIALAGFGLVVVASFAFDHFGLFGLKQGGRPAFRTPGLYRVVRHPMMLGFLVGVWAAPHMTVGHVVFAASLTAYILVGVHFEERSLLRELGESYARYRTEVPMLLPWPRPSREEAGSDNLIPGPAARGRR